ncbi:MAG: plasmid pRiA4b ORF-3 family protein, partial [Pseudonocardia sp.]
MGSKRSRNPGQKRAAKQQARQRRNRSTVAPLFPASAVDPALIDSFVQWLRRGDLTEDAELFAHLVESTLTNLAHAHPGFRATGWLLADAHTLLDAADELTADNSEDMDDIALTIVASALTFLNFLDETRLWTSTEENLIHCIEDLIHFVEPQPPVVLPEDIALPAVDEKDELRALTSLPLIASLVALVDWVVNSTRAVRGPNAELIADRTTRALPLIRAAVTEFVRSQLVSTQHHPLDLTQLTDVVVTQVILAGMTSEPPVADSEDAPSGDEQSLLDSFVYDRLDRLVEQKWLTKDDAYRVPAALQPAVLRAVQLAGAETEYALSDMVDSHVTLRISLEGNHIPVWRRVRLDASLPLSALHDIIQSAFGWEDCHLHEFSAGPAYSGGRVFIPNEDFAHRDLVGPAVAEEEV